MDRPMQFWRGANLVKEPLTIQVRADFAMFGRPENLVSQVSYMFCTPSAGRGLCKTVYHNNYYFPVLRKLEILNPIRTLNIGQTLFRNHTLSRTGKYSAPDKPLKAPTTGVFLQDVEYRLHFDVYAVEPKKIRTLRRRLTTGAAHCLPYLGVRDCVAEIVPVDTRPADQTVNLMEASMFIGMRPATIFAKNGIVEFPDWTFEALVELSEYRWDSEGRARIQAEEEDDAAC